MLKAQFRLESGAATVKNGQTSGETRRVEDRRLLKYIYGEPFPTVRKLRYQINSVN